MSTIRLVALLLVAALQPPKPYRFRFQVNVPAALASEKPRIAEALRRGLFADSLIVEGAPRPPFDPSAPHDSATLAGLSQTMVVRGNVRDTAGFLEVRLELLNVLARRVAGPDTLRVLATVLDSALAEQGRRYAKLLAQRRP
jgi:hypothetical protein